MTISEVLALSQRRGQRGAVGKYQFMYGTLLSKVRENKIPLSSV
jgi:hypothetical protein